MTKLKYAMTDRERIEYLGRTHPSVCIFILTRLDMNQYLTDYKDFCKSKEDNPEDYFYYVHGYILPILQNMRVEGKIRRGKYDHTL